MGNAAATTAVAQRVALGTQETEAENDEDFESPDRRVGAAAG